MKYIKLYEKQIESLYKIGDYVLLDKDKIIEYDLNHTSTQLNFDDPFAKICNFNRILNPETDFPYSILLYDDQLSHVREEEIIRKLTPKEIKKFEIKKAALKYNI